MAALIGRGGARTRQPRLVERTCARCRNTFDAWTRVGPLATYCSGRCRSAASYARLGRRPRPARPCRAGCGAEAAPRRAYCSNECRPSAKHAGLLATARELVCARGSCEVAFTTRKPNRRYCSEACHRMATFDRAGRGKGRRFPRVRYAQRRRILDRDGWACQLCHAPIDPQLTFPHPGSASIDHRDPDGEHVDANLQAAHLGCNVEKGRKHHLGAAAWAR